MFGGGEGVLCASSLSQNSRGRVEARNADGAEQLKATGSGSAGRLWHRALLLNPLPPCPAAVTLGKQAYKKRAEF